VITIKVCHESTGHPARRARVSLGFSSAFRGVTHDQLTGDEGEAHFDADKGEGEVYVNGRSRYKGRLAGRVVVYI
jgi:hypothetical protein